MKHPVLLWANVLAMVAACEAPPTIAAHSPPVSARARVPDVTARSVASAPINIVVQWNRELLQIVRTPGAQPRTVHPTRSFTLLHAAVYDAVNAIDQSGRPFLVDLSRESAEHASPEAAAAAAAHDILIALYPAFSVQLNQLLDQSLAAISDGAPKSNGRQIGQDVAARTLALREHDGSAASPIPFIFEPTPGRYQSTPPDFPLQPQFTHWSRVTPFVLERADEFRPAPPPSLAGERYGNALDEVAALGIANGTVATADQALTGRFWGGAIQNYWNEIAQTLSIAHGLSTVQNARLFAALDAALADAVIAFYDAKYTYAFWRPVTAIRAADSDLNARTVAQPNWLPAAGKTPPDPSYPGAHAVISAAAASILTTFFDTDHMRFDVTSEVLPGVQRSFTALSDAAREAATSRIFAGVHFRFDLTAGDRLGRKVADVVANRFLHEPDATRRRPDHREERP